MPSDGPGTLEGVDRQLHVCDWLRRCIEVA